VRCVIGAERAITGCYFEPHHGPVIAPPERLRCRIRAWARLSAWKARRMWMNPPPIAWGFRVSRRNSGCMPLRRTCGVIVTGRRLPAQFGQPELRKQAMSSTRKLFLGLLASFVAMTAASAQQQAQQQQRKPNILFIMGDDIGWMQPSIYHRGLMVGETPNIDRMAQEGGISMHYYAEESCTAGRTAFFTGMHPLRAGMIPPQLPGSPTYLLPGTPALAVFLRELGYNAGEFGKNHLGDHTDSLPTAHGFQEFWGYLYHL